MKVCVLSNSHAAGLQLGWQLFSTDDSTDVFFQPQFFASRQNRLKDLRACQGLLVCNSAEVSSDLEFTSRSPLPIDLKSYDAVVIHALGLRMYYDIFSDNYYTRSFMNEWGVWRYNHSVCCYLLEQIRLIGDCPVILSPQPHWSENDSSLRSHANRLDDRLIDFPKKMMEYACRENVNTYAIQQPAATIRHRFFTAESYSANSRRLNVGDQQSDQPHPKTDHQHMNASYGYMVWESLAKALKKLANSGS